jgi:hypothetical protein
MATAAEREQQHAMAAHAGERFHELAGTFRRHPASPVAAKARARPAAAPVQRPARPSSASWAARLLDGIPWWQLAVRRAAREEAERQADQEHQRLIVTYEQRRQEQAAESERQQREQELEQQLLDLVHRRIDDGEPRAVSLTIGDALGRLPLAADLVSLKGSQAALRVSVPGVEAVVPEREPIYTAGGKPSTRKLNQTERNDRYAEVVCAAALAAARTALGVTASLERAAVLVCASGAPVAYCSLTSGAWRRWSSRTDVVEAFYDSDGWMEQAGRTRALQPLDLDEIRGLDRALAADRSVA